MTVKLGGSTMKMGSCCRCWPPRFSVLSPSFIAPSPIRRVNLPFHHLPRRASSLTSDHAIAADFSWADVLNFSSTRQQDSSGLSGFLDKVKMCNRNADKLSEFIPFVVEGLKVGFVHNRFAQYLREYKDVFSFPNDTSDFGYYLTLHSWMSTPAERTEALGEVIKSLGEEYIPGIRNELYPVTSSFGETEYLALERAAAPYFGIKAYGVHMNGYVERGGQKLLWVGKRSKLKQTYPGKLDHLVAGGLPNGISCTDNLVKECEEEAGIPFSISSKAIAVGAISYMDIDGYRLKRDVLFCYDLKLPEDFIPMNEDGEVESFMLIPIAQVANIIRDTDYFKPNCSVVIIDFLFRHGYIKPEEFGYLKLLQSLRSGECA